MSMGTLGRTYQDGEVIVRQGEHGDRLFVIQEGMVEVVIERHGEEIPIGVAGKDELIGEMAIFERKRRVATVRARGFARVLTLDKKNFLRRIAEDPTLAFRIIETMSRRLRKLDEEIAGLKAKLAVEAAARPGEAAESAE